MVKNAEKGLLAKFEWSINWSTSPQGLTRKEAVGIKVGVFSLHQDLR